MFTPRQCVRDCVETCKVLMKLDDLTDEEIEAVQEMMDQLSARLTSERDSEP